jgi:hypothetical protein
MYNPGRLPDLFWDGGKYRGVAFMQRVAEASTEDLGEGAHWDKELRVGFVPGSVRAKSAASGEYVDVWVVLKLASPCVQDSGQAWERAKETGITAEIQQRGG